MKRTLLALTIAAGLLSACSDDEIVEVKDYGLKSFEADLAFNSEAAHGEVAYTQQTYFGFEGTDAVAFGNYGTETWTEFFLIEDTTAFNATSDVEGWDLVFTNYTINLGTEEEPYPYGVTGVLVNLDKNIQVASVEDTVSTDFSAAFAELSLSDVSGLSYSSDVDAIGYDWKTLNWSTYQYDVSDNIFYIIQKEADTYKLRFTGFYGTSSDERIVKIEYQLMQ